jgi:uncharacterized membrane protein YfcA
LAEGCLNACLIDRAAALRHHPRMPHLNELLLIATVFVLSGTVKGITGMGLPTVAISLLGLWMLPAQAAALLVAPTLATNVAQCRGPNTHLLLRRLWPAWLALAAVTVLAPGLGGAPLPFDPRHALGAILVIYGAWGLWRPRLPDLSRLHPAWGAVAGGAAGLLTALTAVSVMPLVPYLQSLKLDKDALVQALGMGFTVAMLALALRLQASGGLNLWSAATAVALVAAFAGMGLGGLARGRLSGPAFQRALFIVFIGLGLANLSK